MTVLEIVNRVLRRLREDPVGSITETEYSEVIGDFVVDIHKELLGYDWSSMRHTIDVPVEADQRVLNLSAFEGTGTGDVLAGGRLPTSESLPLWGKWFESSTSVQGFPLQWASQYDVDNSYYLDTSRRVQNLECIHIHAHPSADGLEAVLDPVPNVARHIRLNFWTPEADIDTSADNNRTLLIPWRPIWLGALCLALNERGEEIGEPGGVAERRYLDAFALAKEADVLRKNDSNEYFASRI